MLVNGKRYCAVGEERFLRKWKSFIDNAGFRGCSDEGSSDDADAVEFPESLRHRFARSRTSSILRWL